LPLPFFKSLNMCNNCINADLQAENDELKKQVSALTQALETQKRENQPYIKELEDQRDKAFLLLKQCAAWAGFNYTYMIRSKVASFLKTENATGGDKPEQKQ